MPREGVQKGRLSLNRFVELTATNPAKLYGLYPRKGTIAIGADADIAVWDPQREVTIAKAAAHLERLGIAREVTGRSRNKLYAYTEYLALLSEGISPAPGM